MKDIISVVEDGSVKKKLYVVPTISVLELSISTEVFTGTGTDGGSKPEASLS